MLRLAANLTIPEEGFVTPLPPLPAENADGGAVGVEGSALGDAGSLDPFSALDQKIDFKWRFGAGYNVHMPTHDISSVAVVLVEGDESAAAAQQAVQVCQSAAATARCHADRRTACL